MTCIVNTHVPVTNNVLMKAVIRKAFNKKAKWKMECLDPLYVVIKFLPWIVKSTCFSCLLAVIE